MPEVIFKKKYRWFMEVDFPSCKITPFEVRVHTRPTLQIEEKELPNGVLQLGEQKWSPLVTSFCIDNSEPVKDLFKLVEKMFLQPATEDVMPEIGVASLKMYDGCGVLLEEWVMRGAYIQHVSVSDLDFSSNDMLHAELIWKYQEVYYTPGNQVKL